MPLLVWMFKCQKSIWEPLSIPHIEFFLYYTTTYMNFCVLTDIVRFLIDYFIDKWTVTAVEMPFWNIWWVLARLLKEKSLQRVCTFSLIFINPMCAWKPAYVTFLGIGSIYTWGPRSFRNAFLRSWTELTQWESDMSCEPEFCHPQTW